MFVLSLAASLAAASPVATTAPDEYYISLPNIHAIQKLDTDKGTLEPWAKGMQIPFYGEFGRDGHLYVQDTQLAAIWKIAPDGTPEVLSIGGLIGTPLSVAIHPITEELYVSDALNQWVLIVDPNDGSQRVFSDNSHGLYTIPGGMTFGPDGTLYMTDHGGYQIWAIDENGVPTELVDGLANGMEVPAGIEADNAGNLFVANYLSNTVVRIRTETGEVQLLSDSSDLGWPNDVEFAPHGGLVVCNDAASQLVEMDSFGNTTVLHHDASVGSWVGVAYPGMSDPCTGSMEEYGSGTAGTGGRVPRLTGMFNPCAGTSVAYVIDQARPNARGLFLYALDDANIPAWGGELLIDITGFWGKFGFKTDDMGKKIFEFEHPDDPALDGVDFYLQSMMFDPENSYGIALSNGLHVHFGDSN